MGVLFILNKKWGICIILVCIFSVLAIASASAADLNNTGEITTDDVAADEGDVLEVNEDDFLEINDEESVLEAGDNEEVLGASYQQFSDIQEQINAANPGDTIYLNGTYYGFGDPLIIEKPIKLVGLGDGAVLKANVNTNIKYCAIYVGPDASDVLIDNLKISGGCNNWGGGIYIYLADRTTISNCLFKDNSADGSYGYGGAIWLWAEDCLITNCTFTNNHCTDFGGAIYANRQNNKITNCVFNYNYISNEISEEGLEICRGGGAIYSDCQSLIIDNCTFTDNSARESYGGALRLAASCNVKNSVFKDNAASLAKAVYCGSEIIKFTGNTFSLEYKEDPDTLFEGITADELKATNTFNKTRIDSNVNFHAGMVFEYGTFGTIYVTVDGGSIVKEKIRVLNHPEAQIDFKDNVITVSNLPVGVFTLRVTTVPDDDHVSVDRDLKVTVNKATAVIKASKITVALKKGSLWTIRLVNSKTGKPISNMKLTLNVYTGKKCKTVTLTTNAKGEANYQTKGLAKGNHKAVVSAKDSRYNFNTLTSSIKVVKQTALKFKVNKRAGKDGASLSITVMNKKTKKHLNGIKIKLLIYTGKQYVTVTLKSMKKGKFVGVCGYGTNKLSVGTHKVKIMPVDIRYSGSASSSMKITSRAKKVPAWETKDSAK